MTVSPPPVFNLVFPIANGMALTPAEVAAIVQRTINGRRPVKRRRQANESETSSDGVPGGTLITAVAEAIATATADTVGATIDPDSEDVVVMTDMMAALPAVSPSVTDAQSPCTPFASPMQHPPIGTLPPLASWWPVALPGPAPMAFTAEADCLDMAPAPMGTDTRAEPAIALASAPAVGAGAS